MKKMFCLLVLFVFPLALFHGRSSSLTTNVTDVGSIPSMVLKSHETAALYSAVSNELRLMIEYLRLTNNAGSGVLFGAIVESKRYHLQLIDQLFDKHSLPDISYEVNIMSNVPDEKKIRETCKRLVKEELENKMFYEKHLMKVKSPDLKTVFALIAGNSEKTFKLLQSYILKK